MDKATKAALFSAFLFPGWEQLYLKLYKKMKAPTTDVRQESTSDQQ